MYLFAFICLNLVSMESPVHLLREGTTTAPRSADSTAEPDNFRKPSNDADLKYWLENMILHHGYSTAEVCEATGLTRREVEAAVNRFKISAASRPRRPEGSPLKVLPYPGGRHPRIGFLEGAIKPQRETKVSVFTPWDESSYAVVDVPEAIWSNLGLIYLAHTHVPTIWSKQRITLPVLEWLRKPDGSYEIERKLPNGISFGANVVPGVQGVRLQLWLKNGTKEVLSDLRVQNCVMLKGAKGFESQTNKNKLLQNPYVACRSEDGRRWIITAWTPCHRPWANDRCPCLHSDPKFLDCPPGKTVWVRGWLSFYEGSDILREFRRLDTLKWQQPPTPGKKGAPGGRP